MTATAMYSRYTMIDWRNSTGPRIGISDSSGSAATADAAAS